MAGLFKHTQTVLAVYLETNQFAVTTLEPPVPVVIEMGSILQL